MRSGEHQLVCASLLQDGTFASASSSIWLRDQCLQKALEVTRKLHMDQKSAWILNNLGGVYFQQNDRELALSYHVQSLGIKEKLKDPDPADLASSLMNVGLDYQMLGNYPKSAASYDRVLELTAGGNSPPLHALVLFNYGELQRREGRPGPAREKITAALREAARRSCRWHPLGRRAWFGVW